MHKIWHKPLLYCGLRKQCTKKCCIVCMVFVNLVPISCAHAYRKNLSTHHMDRYNCLIAPASTLFKLTVHDRVLCQMHPLNLSKVNTNIFHVLILVLFEYLKSLGWNFKHFVCKRNQNKHNVWKKCWRQRVDFRLIFACDYDTVRNMS